VPAQGKEETKEVNKMGTIHGVDLSVHNGTVDFSNLKNSGKANFAILRAGYGKLASQKDKKFETYYNSCK